LSSLRLGLRERVLDHLDRLGGLFEHHAGDDLARIGLEEIRGELVLDLQGRLEDVLEDLHGSPLGIELRQVRPELLAHAIHLVAGDAGRDLEDLLAIGERAAVVELGDSGVRLLTHVTDLILEI